MRMPKPATVDFETLPSAKRPAYPPVPVGVSIKLPGRKSKYYAWGHVTGGNNCSYGEAQEALRKAWDTKDGVLFHHGRFDMDVAEVHMGMPPLPWHRYHDSLLLLYLDDPRRRNFKLKDNAEEVLGLPPDERDAVADWLITHQPVPGVRIQKSKAGENNPGKYIGFAPGEVVGPYAEGDTDRTYGLFEKMWVDVAEAMGPALDRERELSINLLSMERRGVNGDVRRLGNDIDLYENTRIKIELWVNKKIGTSGVSLRGMEFAEALVSSGFADASKMGVTASGKLKTDKAAFNEGVTDPQMAAMLRYHGAVSTCLDTFMKPWYEMMTASGGLIYTTWNATRTPGDVGTTTGRLSSTPNFQNIPKTFAPMFKHETEDGLHPETKKVLPKAPFELPPLPRVRSYITPSDGCVLVDRDYSQQELRILGHVEGGVLADAYNEDPWLDLHDHAKDMINTMLGTDFKRKPIKNTGFGLIYGMGLGKLALQSSIEVSVAKQVRDAYLAIFPGLKTLYKEMKRRAKMGEPVWTWGGRRYFCEDPIFKDGRMMEFDYKLLNVIIQGSAADCTKEAVNRYYRTGMQVEAPMILQVHDQLTLDAIKKRMRESMEILRQCMESVEFSVPMLSEGAYSFDNWGSLEDYDTKGVIVYAG